MISPMADDLRTEGANLPLNVAELGLDLAATGSLDGGAVSIFRHENLVGNIILGPICFRLLGKLLEQSAGDVSGGVGAFVSSRQLARHLVKQGLWFDADPLNVAKAIHRLRKQFNTLKLPAELMLPGKLGALLIENERHLGYRIGLPPDRLSLRLVE